MADTFHGQQRSVLDALLDAVILVDAAGCVREWNSAAEALYGWRREDAVGTLLDDLVPSANVAESADAPGAATSTNRRSRSGQVQMIATVRSGQLALTGEPTLICDRDVELEVGLRQRRDLAEARYRTMFETMPIGFVESDFSALGAMLIEMFESGTMDVRQKVRAEPAFLEMLLDAPIMVDLNPEAMRIYGAAEKSDLVGRPLGTTIADKQKFLGAIYASTQDEQTVYTTEMLNRRLDGSPVEVFHSVFLSPETKTNFTTFTCDMDLSELKSSERQAIESQDRYRNVFESMPIGFLSLDWATIGARLSELRSRGVTDLMQEAEHDTGLLVELLSLAQVVDANETAVSMLRASSREDLFGPVARFWPLGSQRVFLTAVSNGFLGNPRFESQTRLLTLDGCEIEVIFTAIAPRSGLAAGTIVIGIVDISDRLAALAVVERLQADLTHAGRVAVLGELTASIAHEVNQPLAAIAANGQAGLRWLSRPDIDVEEIRALTTRMVDDAYRAADIIARIRGMAAKRTADRGPVSVNDIIEESVSFVRHEMHVSGVELSTDLAPNLPMIEADRTQLQQVMVNLAMNALQAMSLSMRSPRTLEIRTFQSSDAVIDVEITDNGPGLEGEHLERLFDSFFTTKEEGIGIGLPICRSIVEAHGGQIRADNVPTGGARFTFSVAAPL
jgi:signal transduction histidine kinase